MSQRQDLCFRASRFVAASYDATEHVTLQALLHHSRPHQQRVPTWRCPTSPRIGVCAVFCLLVSFLVAASVAVAAPSSGPSSRPSSRPVSLPVQAKAASRAAPRLKAEQEAWLTALRSLAPKIQEAFQRGRYSGLSIGVVRGDRLVFSQHLGFAHRDRKIRADRRTLYRIGSITKVFTASLLVRLRDLGSLHLDQSAGDWLKEVKQWPTDSRGAPAITLRHLATHTSGLPRIPVNLKPIPLDPYNGFTAQQLFAGIAKTTLERPIGARYAYSNLGYSLLGHVLVRAGGKDYATLLRQHILDPLGLKDTVLTLSASQRKKLATGYKGSDPTKVASVWRLGAMAPAGALVSNVADLAKFIAYQFRAGQANVRPLSGGSLTEMHALQRLLGRSHRGFFTGGVGLGWHVFPSRGYQGRMVWHNGGVAGFRSFIGFSPEAKVGVVVLTNCGRSVDRLGFGILNVLAAALMRQKPKPTTPNVVLDAARQLARYFVANPSPQVATLFDARFRAQVPTAQVLGLFKKIYARYGKVVDVNVRPTRRPKVSIVKFVFAKKKKLFAYLVVDTNTKKITGLRILPQR